MVIITVFTFIPLFLEYDTLIFQKVFHDDTPHNSPHWWQFIKIRSAVTYHTIGVSSLIHATFPVDVFQCTF